MMGATNREARMARLILGCLLCVGLGACRLERHYVWTQTADGLAMKAPIVHRVHVRVDVERSRVTLVDDLIDAEGRTDRQFSEFGESQVTPCRVVDKSNWQCQLLTLGGATPAVTVDMKDGHLVRHYWGAVQQFEAKYRLASMSQ